MRQAWGCLPEAPVVRSRFSPIFLLWVPALSLLTVLAWLFQAWHKVTLE